MPGYSPECVSGAHAGCVERDCRCQCHPWTQALLRQGPAKTDGRGGVERTLTAEQLKEIHSPQVPELRNTCPQCGRSFKPTDAFCRQDGTRLALGKQCLGCGAPEEPDDQFCWQCGLRAGEKPPSQDAPPAEELVEKIKRLAREKGILKETTV